MAQAASVAVGATEVRQLQRHLSHLQAAHLTTQLLLLIAVVLVLGGTQAQLQALAAAALGAAVAEAMRQGQPQEARAAVDLL